MARARQKLDTSDAAGDVPTFGDAAPLATKKTPPDHRIQCRKCRRTYDKGAPAQPTDGLYVCDDCGHREGHE